VPPFPEGITLDIVNSRSISHGARSDPGALSPGREYPRDMYHATKAKVAVSSAQEEKALGPEWSRVYIHREYPKVKYHWSGKSVPVQNADEETALGGGWASSSSVFDAYKGPRRSRIEERADPCKWLDEWSAPGLSSEQRRKIKAQLLRADGAFDRSPDADPESTALACMRQAFEGIALVLLDAGILTQDLLRKAIPELVWNSAIAGGWWRRAWETRQDIFPEPLGHYWVWREDSRESKELFRAETREWEARLLEAPERKTPAERASLSTPPAEDLPNNKGMLLLAVASAAPEEPNSAPPEGDCAFTLEAQRIDGLAAYTERWQCSQAALARTAKVHPADLSKWKKGLLSAASDKKARIERVLKNKEAPTPPPKHGRKSYTSAHN
jgi:hypothetical protein